VTDRKPLSFLLEQKVLRFREPSPTVKAHEEAVHLDHLLIINGYGTIIATVSRDGVFDVNGMRFQS
jgi:hypothetical protein